MNRLESTLLIAGLIFPTLSLMTGTLSLVTIIAPRFPRWKDTRWSSPIFIPLIGPILLTVVVFLGSLSRWWILVFWLSDIGTLAFAVVLPRLIRDEWQISSFNRIMTLRGSSGIQTAILTFHSTGHYHLRRSWNRAKDECGTTGMGETGTFCEDGDAFELKSDGGLRRRLNRTDDHSWLIEEDTDDRPELSEYSMHGWLLTP